MSANFLDTLAYMLERKRRNQQDQAAASERLAQTALAGGARVDQAQQQQLAEAKALAQAQGEQGAAPQYADPRMDEMAKLGAAAEMKARQRVQMAAAEKERLTKMGVEGDIEGALIRGEYGLEEQRLRNEQMERYNQLRAGGFGIPRDVRLGQLGVAETSTRLKEVNDQLTGLTKTTTGRMLNVDQIKELTKERDELMARLGLIGDWAQRGAGINRGAPVSKVDPGTKPTPTGGIDLTMGGRRPM